MSPQTANLPLQGMMAGFRRFSVGEYHKLIDLGILTEDDNLELLEGYLVHKMPHNPPHDGTIQLLQAALLRGLPDGWSLRIRCAITLGDSEPEPDGAVVRGDARTYLPRHPGPADLGVVIEVANTTLVADQIDKCRLYARAGITCYWIINIIDCRVEVYTAPSGAIPSPSYGQRTDYRAGDQVSLVLDGVTVAQFAVLDLLP